MGVKGLFGNERYADFTMQCETRKWKVHKAIICPQSEEGATQCFTFMETTPDVVNAMPTYFYTHDYYDTKVEVLLNARVYGLAEQHLCEPLKDLACKKLASHLDAEWGNAQLVLAVETVYNTEPKGESRLRDCVLAVVRQHIDQLLRDPAMYPDFHATARETPSFLVDVLIGRYSLQTEADAKAPGVARIRCYQRNHHLCAKMNPVPLMLSKSATKQNVLLRCPTGLEGTFDQWKQYL
ncbi:hypothetical protein LTR95_001376 [Oleoguttula sp. CCFEE 5521]